MTTEEKLKHFEDVCTGEAREKLDHMISEYTASLEKLLEEHKQNAARQADLEIRAQEEKLRRDINRRLSVEQIALRRGYSRKQEELRGKIFSELRDRLARFMESPEYTEMLEKQIRKAKQLAGNDEIHIYIDPSDKSRQNMLALHTGCEIRVSGYSFGGGTRAVIEARNILIDSSFDSLLREAEENFQFALGGK